MAAVFFDIDGTLIDQKGKIEESTIRGINALKENGHAVYINSGRTKAYIFQEDLLGIGFDGLLCGCGTNIYLHDEEILCRTIPDKQLYHMIEVFDSYDMPMIIEGRDWLYMDREKIGRDPYGEYVYQSIKHKSQRITGNQQIEASKFSVVTQYHTPEVGRAVMDEFREEFLVANHGDRVVELVPKDCSKATAMQIICEKTGVPMEETYAFGDGVNDIEMLQCAQTGIVMGNGRAPAKEVADYITDDIHADGIWNALRHFKLI